MHNRSRSRQVLAALVIPALLMPASTALARDTDRADESAVPYRQDDEARKEDRASARQPSTRSGKKHDTSEIRDTAKTARRGWAAARRGVVQVRNEAIRDARVEMRAALAVATTDEARAAAKAAFKSAVRAAHVAARAALNELGPKPSDNK